MINLIYTVEIGYTEYVFDCISDAAIFADTAKKHIKEDDNSYKKDVIVRLDVMEDPEDD